MTVNDVARGIGLDQSGASRLVKSAAEAGFLTVEASPSDGRQRQVTVTPTGLEMVEQARRWQEQVFARLTEGWSEQRRRDFHAAMLELTESSYKLGF